jgi:hypothetical protein
LISAIIFSIISSSEATTQVAFTVVSEIGVLLDVGGWIFHVAFGMRWRQFLKAIFFFVVSLEHARLSHTRAVFLLTYSVSTDSRHHRSDRQEMACKPLDAE